MIFNWWGPIEIYLKNRSIYSSFVLYEDILNHPEETILQLFKVLKVSKDYEADKLQAFQFDSQNDFFGSFQISNTNIQHIKVLEEMDREFHRLSIPISTEMSEDQFSKLLY